MNKFHPLKYLKKSDGVILDGIDRDQIELKLLYTKGLCKAVSKVLNPMDQELLRDIEYLSSNNLPIAKEKLYRFIPEMFTLEISDLEPLEQEKIRQNQLRIKLVK